MLKAILFNDTSHNKHHGCQIVVKQIYGEGTLHDDARAAQMLMALAARVRIAFDDVANFVRGSRQQAQQMFFEIVAAVVAARSPQGRPQ